MYEWYFVLLLFLLGGGIPTATSVIRRAFSVDTESPRIVVQYTHVFTEEERSRVERWLDYRKDLECAMVETWLSAVGRGHDLKLFRRYESDDRRLKAELGLTIVDASVGQRRVPAGTLLILTMRPNVEALPALNTLLAQLGWRPLSGVQRFPEHVELYLLEDEGKHGDGPKS